jgi:hypothetical protein
VTSRNIFITGDLVGDELISGVGYVDHFEAVGSVSGCKKDVVLGKECCEI